MNHVTAQMGLFEAVSQLPNYPSALYLCRTSVFSVLKSQFHRFLPCVFTRKIWAQSRSSALRRSGWGASHRHTYVDRAPSMFWSSSTFFPDGLCQHPQVFPHKLQPCRRRLATRRVAVVVVNSWIISCRATCLRGVGLRPMFGSHPRDHIVYFSLRINDILCCAN